MNISQTFCPPSNSFTDFLFDCLPGNQRSDLKNHLRRCRDCQHTMSLAIHMKQGLFAMERDYCDPECPVRKKEEQWKWIYASLCLDSEAMEGGMS